MFVHQTSKMSGMFRLGQFTSPVHRGTEPPSHRATGEWIKWKAIISGRGWTNSSTDTWPKNHNKSVKTPRKYLTYGRRSSKISIRKINEGHPPPPHGRTKGRKAERTSKERWQWRLDWHIINLSYKDKNVSADACTVLLRCVRST